jgi:hypothetical protein
VGIERTVGRDQDLAQVGPGQGHDLEGVPRSDVDLEAPEEAELDAGLHLVDSLVHAAEHTADPVALATHPVVSGDGLAIDENLDLVVARHRRDPQREIHTGRLGEEPSRCLETHHAMLDLAPGEHHQEEQNDGKREPGQGRELHPACGQRSFGSPTRNPAADMRASGSDR